MKKQMHRIISVLLCAAMLIGVALIAPIATSAQTDDSEAIGAADSGEEVGAVDNSDSVGANYQCCSDFIGGGGGLVHFKGWAFNRSNTSETLEIHVYIGGPAGSGSAEGNPFNKANVQRADVNKAYGCGSFHGYDFRVTTNKRGSQPVYVYAVGSGGNTQIASATINIGYPNNPTGCFDGATGGTRLVHVDGWAFDIDNQEESIDVHIYIGGPAGSAGAECHGIKANAYRPDVDSVHHRGKYHGFDANISTNKTGTQPVYAYAINIYGGQNVLLNQKTVTISTSSGGNSHTYETIGLNETKSVKISTASEQKYFRFIPGTTGDYTFYSLAGSGVDTKGYLYNSSWSEIAVNDDGGGNSQFKLTKNLTAGTTYYFGAGMYGNKTGSYSFKLISGSSTSKNLNECQCSLSNTSYAYDGSPKTPTVTVKDGNTTLTNGTHYSVSYRNNTAEGTGSAIITGKGNYTGSVTLTFSISRKTYNLNYTNLTFSFENSYRDMGYNPGSSRLREIPRYNYVKIFGDNQYCTNIYNTYRSEWHGCCFGFSAMSTLLYAEDSPVKPSDFGKPTIWNLSTMDWSNKWGGNTRDWIDAMMVSQYGKVMSNKQRETIVKDSNNRSRLNAIRNAARNVKYTGKPINLGVFGISNGHNSGHSILAYGTVVIDSTHEDILCYDNNYCNKERRVHLTTDTSGNVLAWSYQISDQNTWGTGRGNDYLDYIPYETELAVFNGAEKTYAYSTCVMNVSSSSFTVYDADDKKVATVSDGILESGSDDVFQNKFVDLVLDSDSPERKNVMLYMPVGYYKVVNDFDDDFTVWVVDTDRSTTVTTSGDTVEFMVSDESKVNEAYVYTDPGDTYDIFVASSDDTEAGEMRVKGTSEGSIVSTAMDNGSIYLDNCVGATITINGVPIEKCDVAINVDDNDTMSIEMPKNGIVGDVNFDGIINIKDVLALQRFMADFEMMSERQLMAADVNHDGEVTVEDATILQQYLAGYDVTIA